MTRAELQAKVLAIGDQLGLDVLLDEPLAPYLSMRVGGRAAALVRPREAADVARSVRSLHAAAVPHRLLGGGSNLVAAEEGLDFAVVHVGAVAARSHWEGGRVRVPAGMPLASLLREVTRRDLAGLEWAAGLPGTVGGAVVGNAGAFGGEIGPFVREVVLLSPEGDVRSQVPTGDDFRYRRSFVRPGEVVLEVVLEFEPSAGRDVRADADRVNRTRAASQPKGGHSSGCIFKNPPGGHAGQLIDECGLKGLRRGGAVVSTAHANFIVNEGNATAADVLGLIDEVRDRVRRRTGVELDLEIAVWRAEDAAGRRPEEAAC